VIECSQVFEGPAGYWCFAVRAKKNKAYLKYNSPRFLPSTARGKLAPGADLLNPAKEPL